MQKLVSALIVFMLAGCGSTAPDQPSGEPPADAVPAPDESAALEAIRAIAQAQSEFIARNRRYASSVAELTDALFLPREPAWAASGYRVRVFLSAAADDYRATLTAPDGAGELRSFFVDGTGVVRWASGTEATADSPALDEGGVAAPE